MKITTKTTTKKNELYFDTTISTNMIVFGVCGGGTIY